MGPTVLVAGVGNVFLGDDGFGVEVVRRLATRPLPPAVRIADFGIRGLDLAFALLEPYDFVILVDASQRGGAPGTLYLLEPESLAPDAPALEPHRMVPTQALRMAHQMGAAVRRLVVVACEPESFGDPGFGRMGLSEPVAAAVDEAVQMIETMVHDPAREQVPR
jgi:hydrogenase maturation protease